MRLLSLTVRNYRAHKEFSITFDPSRNLIGGPNESGKSTLVEAIHRALFLRAKTGGNLRQEMLSTRHPGEPEVLLTFEASDSRWELEKRFAGTKGSARLTNASGENYRDDEAETKLSELLKCDTNGGRLSASQLPTFWSHLWVWQGSSGTDPSGHASHHKDTLVQRLQQDGLAAVMQSATDQRVRERIATAYDELFTSTGKPKAGSKPELARLKFTEAETELNRAQETAKRLEEDAAEYHRATKEIEEADALLPTFREKRIATEARLAEVEKLRHAEESQRQTWKTFVALQKQLRETDASILQLQQQATEARAALLPAERMEASLFEKEQELSAQSKTAETSQRQSADIVRLKRQQHDLAAASITAFEKAVDHKRLNDRHTEADQIRREIVTQNEALSQLPNVTLKDVDTLRQLDRSASQASASLNAMATGIELLTADLNVTLDGQPLTVGESRTLTDLGELAIGQNTKLRIRPGGGTSLAEARLKQENSERNLRTALDRLTLRDLDHATLVLQQRVTFSQQIAQLEARWKALGGATLSAELAAAITAHDAAKAEVQRRLDALDSRITLPENLEAARQFRATLLEALQLAEDTENDARIQSEQIRKRLETALANLQKHRDQTSQSRQSLRDLETKIQVLQETHGDATTRQTSLLKARENVEQNESILNVTKQALAALVPDLLSADLDRFSRAISLQENRRREAENLRLISRDRLTLDGSTDPHAELSFAQARHSAAYEIYQFEQRRAKAIEQLHQLFSSSREAIDRSLAQPLADRISGYLQCLFGPAAQVRVKLSETGIEGLELLRSGDTTFSFQSLSGGAKEQVAAAVRLAMAEILATDHHNTLPIVFDDAFAYTDPDRIHALQRMLDLAANRGLQVIVLSCTPGDYSSLGAKTSIFA